MSVAIQTVDWAAYALSYDVLAEHNPAYAALRAAVLCHVAALPLRTGDTILDIGAGTGGMSLPLAQAHPGVRVVHLEPDAGMADAARRKVATLGVCNVEIVTTSFEDYGGSECSVAVAVAVHSLYTLRDPEGALRRMYHLQRPGGCAVLCDLGRVLDLWDWRRYLLLHLLARRGPRAALRMLRELRGAATQNSRIRHCQLAGEYWRHTTAEFARAVGAAGYTICSAYTTYRGYSDLVVAHKEGDGCGVLSCAV